MPVFELTVIYFPNIAPKHSVYLLTLREDIKFSVCVNNISIEAINQTIIRYIVGISVKCKMVLFFPEVFVYPFTRMKQEERALVTYEKYYKSILFCLFLILYATLCASRGLIFIVANIKQMAPKNSKNKTLHFVFSL